MKKRFTKRLRPKALLFLLALNALYISSAIAPLLVANAKIRDTVASSAALLESQAKLGEKLARTESSLSEAVALRDAAASSFAVNTPLNKTQKQLHQLTASSGLYLQKLEYAEPRLFIDSDGGEGKETLLQVNAQLSLAGEWQNYLDFRRRIASEFAKIEIKEERIEKVSSKKDPQMYLDFILLRHKSVLQ